MPEIVNNAWMVEDDGSRVYDHAVLYEDLSDIFPIIDYVTVAELEKYEPGPALIAFVADLANQAYTAKVNDMGDGMEELERYVLLKAVNDRWMEHLQTIEYIREGIGLRGYGQVDPLVAYKRETYDTFQTTLKGIRDQAAKMVYVARFNRPQVRDIEFALDQIPASFQEDGLPPELAEQHGFATTAAPTLPAIDLAKIDWTKVSRNDACPCGSGKKFKACHYPLLRADGVI
jgi:preprotein translocase subunit SecA